MSALGSTLHKGDDDEIDRRWRRGLTADQFSTKCATFLQLSQRWNELGVTRGTAGPPQAELRIGGRSSMNACEACGSDADSAHGSRGGVDVWLCRGCLADATEWAREQEPGQPFEADVAQWAAQQRNTEAA